MNQGHPMHTEMGAGPLWVVAYGGNGLGRTRTPFMVGKEEVEGRNTTTVLAAYCNDSQY